MNRNDLKNYRYNKRWIEGRMEYIEEYKSSITKITTTLSDMPKGSKKVEDSIAEKVAVLLDNVDDLLKKVVEQSNRQKEILEQLEKVEQPYRNILEAVYIQGKTLVTVASEMHYSYERVRHMNGIALKKFDEKNIR